MKIYYYYNFIQDTGRSTKTAQCIDKIIIIKKKIYIYNNTKTFKKDANEALQNIIQTHLKSMQASGPMFPEAR